MIRSFHHSQFPLELLREQKRETVTVVLPAREVADTIAPTIEGLRRLDGLVDQILATHTGQEVEKIARDTDRDFILSAEQALEYGLVDEILTGRRAAPELEPASARG